MTRTKKAAAAMDAKLVEALEPTRAGAMDRAEEQAREWAAVRRAALEAAGNHLFTLYPEPAHPGRVSHWSNEYQAYRAERKRIESLRAAYFLIGKFADRCIDRDGTMVRLFEITDASIDAFVEKVRKQASDNHDAFVAKLTSKIGAPVLSASLFGDHVWDFSNLTVETAEGRQIWRTQMIVNCSVLGKLFNQWPSRQVKG